MFCEGFCEGFCEKVLMKTAKRFSQGHNEKAQKTSWKPLFLSVTDESLYVLLTFIWEKKKQTILFYLIMLFFIFLWQSSEKKRNTNKAFHLTDKWRKQKQRTSSHRQEEKQAKNFISQTNRLFIFLWRMSL